MRRICVLINNTGLGGAERRLGRLFAKRADTDPGTCLVVNRGLWLQLQAAGLVRGGEARVWCLAEPWGALVSWLGLQTGAVRFWLKKLDYVLFAFLLLGRYGMASRRQFHAVLGGTYVMLPLMLTRWDHAYAISVTNRNLAMMVGVSWALPIYRFALRRCHAIDALSVGVREDLIERGIPPEKILASPGSVVNLDHFSPSREKDPWVVFAGRLVEEKNPLLFLEAIPAIRAEVPAARFFVLGEGPLRSDIEKTLDRLNLRDAVDASFRDDPAPVFRRARVFVSLQRQDNYPSQSLLEAMASGTVPVATDVGLTWQLVDETTGLRVKPDPGEIAVAVTRLLKDPSACERLGRAARQRVAERHSEDTYRTHLDLLYRSLTQRGGVT